MIDNTKRGEMTLRDWFAGQAIAGLYGSMAGAHINQSKGDLLADAVLAYRVADAMLKARVAILKDKP